MKNSFAKVIPMLVVFFAVVVLGVYVYLGQHPELTNPPVVYSTMPPAEEPVVHQPATSTPPAPTPVVVTPTPPQLAQKCYIGGCSAQLCTDQPDMVSNCMYTAAYACYKTATCERQPSGQCGWTPTAELNSCIQNANSSSPVDSPQ